MKRIVVQGSITALALLILRSASAQIPQQRPIRPMHTFSIVARDAETGELGVAVQSHWFSVGTLAPWAEAGIGAVATQSFVEPSYGKLGLELMRAGKSAPDALKALLAGDDGREHRRQEHPCGWAHRRERLLGASQSDAERKNLARDVARF